MGFQFNGQVGNEPLDAKLSVDELLFLWTETANIRTVGVASEIVFLLSNNGQAYEATRRAAITLR